MTRGGIERVPLGSLKRYLAVMGWHSRRLPNGNDLFWFGPDDDSIEIVLPETSQAREASERVMNAIVTLTALERRTFDDIVTAVRSISYDLIRARLPEAAIRHDTIKLGTAEVFIKRVHGALEASAHNELHPGPFYARVSSIAHRFAEDCRFGHTFRGSFGFTVEAQVGPQTQDLGTEPPSPPLARRAIRRFARGLRIIETAIAQENPSIIVDGFNAGLNANACEELSLLASEPQITELSFEVVFSPEWGAPEDLGPTPVATISQARGVHIINEATKALRIVYAAKQRTIVGKVRTLHSMETPADLYSIEGLQDIIVEWESEELGKRNVRVSLGPEEYLAAVEAHKQGRFVRATGELEQGRQLRLDNARDFELLP